MGVCQDRKVQFVYAFEHEEVVARARRAQQRADGLETLIRQLAYTTPRKGEWERSYVALQIQARRVLATLVSDAPDRDAPAGAVERTKVAPVIPKV